MFELFYWLLTGRKYHVHVWDEKFIETGTTSLYSDKCNKWLTQGNWYDARCVNCGTIKRFNCS